MFHSYDLKKFGDKLRNVRKELGISQGEIRKQVGINEDTLRKIENGLVVPKYETLELLSQYLKYDFLECLKNSRQNIFLNVILNKIDKIILSNSVEELNQLISEYDDLKMLDSVELKLFNPNETMQFELFLSAIDKYYTGSQIQYLQAEQLLFKALKLGNEKFRIEKFDRFNYNLFELRLLLLIGILNAECKKYDLSNKIMIFVLKKSRQISGEDEMTMQFIIKIYTNLAYNYHQMNQEIKSLKYSNKGIEFALKNNSLYCLALLFYRKGISEFRISDNHFVDSLKKSRVILELQDEKALLEKYVEVTRKQYGIEF